jgi:hypothetical protein
VNNVPHHPLDVTMLLGKVQGAEFWGSFAMMGMRGEDGTCSLTLGSDDTTHFFGEWIKLG